MTSTPGIPDSPDSVRQNAKPGRIPVLLSDGTTAFGGARVCFRDLLENLDKDIFEVHALMRDDVLDFRGIPGVTFHYYPYLLQFEIAWELRKRRWLPKKAASSLSIPIHFATHFLPYSVFLIRLCRRHRIRLIHINNQLLYNFPTLSVARLLGIPVVSHQREFPVPSKVVKNRLCDSLIHRHIAVSGSIGAALVRAGIPARKIQVIYDSVDFGKLSEAAVPKPTGALKQVGVPKAADENGLKVKKGPLAATGESDFKMGMFGRVTGWKGQMQVIQAVESAVRRNPHLKLYIVGNASDAEDGYLEACEEYCRAHRLERWVEFTGYIPKPHILMAGMDAIVHNSVTPEPFGMVVAEGMALGRVVLASRLGGPAEIIEDGVNGYLADPLDVETLAEKLLYLAERFALSPAEFAAVGAAGAATVREKFNLRIQVGKVGRLYREILAGPRTPSAAPAPTASDVRIP
ncbi:MAG: glycosyltransferase family 4 protein [Fibrobacteria bacterium]